MSRTTNQRVLFAVSLIGVVVGGMDVLGSTLSDLLGKVVASVSPQVLEQAGITFSANASDVVGALRLVSYASVVCGMAGIVAGALGMRAANDATKATPALLAATFCLAVVLAECVLGLMQGSGIVELAVAALLACLSYLVRREARSVA